MIKKTNLSLKHSTNIARFLQIIVFVGIYNICFSQSNLTAINEKSLENYVNSYNYTYWNDNWKSTIDGPRNFSNYTSSYSLNIDYDALSIKSLLVNDNSLTKEQGFKQLNDAIFPINYEGNIEYAILTNGAIAYDKSATPTNSGTKDSQLAEFGVWCNRRFVSVNFNNNPSVDTYYTGVEFTNWHNRFKITFHVKPTANITNGQLQLAVDIPEEYNEYYHSGKLHAYGLNDKGFVLKGSDFAESVAVEGNKITVTTAAENLLANTMYEVSILCYVMEDNLSSNFAEAFEDEKEINITASQTIPVAQEITNINYNNDEAIHYIDIPRHNMGYNSCQTADRLQNINLTLTNSSSIEKRTKLCIRQIPSVNVAGFNSILCNNNGDPSGLPIQVSKNWHTTTSQLYSGSWIKEYTEIIIPANSTMELVYRRTGAKWGETYTASSHQLAVVGASVPRGGWLEAALGSFGENITHSPDYEYGNTVGADVRPFLVTNEAYGGNSSECGWTGNLGGIGMLIYANESGTRNYHAQVKTDFKAYSPNLTETSVSSISEDKKLKFDYTFYLNRSDDFTRIYYKIHVEALQDANFDRFDIFQLGGDTYNIYNAQSIAYGNDSGLIGQFNPTNDGSNDYTTSEIALTGENPWLWAGDGLYYDGATSGKNIDTNNGIIIREYNATFAGIEKNTPYVMERSSSQGFSSSYGTNPTSYCLVTPPEVTSFKAGDKIELLVEVVVLPKQDGDYYGPNENFSNALSSFGNSYELLYRESLGNKVIAESATNTVHSSYPLTVETSENSAHVTVTGGKGYIPIIFSGLSNVTNPVLWRSYDNSTWEVVDQSVHGKDFWQVNYNPNTKLFDLVYNINQDISNDNTAVIHYYLGPPPTESSIVIQSQIDDNSWTSNKDLEINLDEVEKITFGPAIKENGSISHGINENWHWTGPNNFSKTGRVLRITPVSENDLGDYHVSYTNSYNYTSTATYTISEAPLLSITNNNNSNFKLSPIPVKTHLYVAEQSLSTEIKEAKIYTTSGSLVKTYGPLKEFNVSELSSGIYVFRVTFDNGTSSNVRFMKE